MQEKITTTRNITRTSISSERQTEQDFFSLDTKTVALRKHLCTQHMQRHGGKKGDSEIFQSHRNGAKPK